MWMLACVLAVLGADQAIDPEHVVHVTSTMDGADQPCLFVAVPGDEPRPLLVGLHTWSNAFDTCKESVQWQREAEARGWHYLQPHFRGPNLNPDACASPKARQDILDAVDYACEHAGVDANRIYLAGVSGGAHMAVVMAAHAPERWAAVTAWCPIADLAAWHRETRASGRLYWQNVEACCGGAPGSSPEADEQLRARSPLYSVHKAKDVPLDLNAGIHDGHTGSVPIHHVVDLFNALAEARGDATVSAADIERLSQERPLDRAEEQDSSYGRPVYLRRYAGPTRLTLFEGGHEMLAAPACDWLATHTRKQE